MKRKALFKTKCGCTQTKLIDIFSNNMRSGYMIALPFLNEATNIGPHIPAAKFDDIVTTARMFALEGVVNGLLLFMEVDG